MKTIEEKDDAIITELQRLFEIQQRVDLDLWEITTWLSKDYHALSWYQDERPIKIEYFGRTTLRGFDPINAERVYRLLGLSERNAVEEYETALQAATEMMERQKTVIDLQETRAAKLVEDVQEIMHHHGYFYANGHGEHQGRGGERVFTPVGRLIQAALDHYKEGGAGE